MNAEAYRLVAASRPRYRGVLHTWCAAASVPAGVALVVSAGSAEAAFGAAVFAYGVFLMFFTSALFHRTDYDDIGWYRYRRIDHLAIFVCIASGYTAIGMLGLDGWATELLLYTGWLGAGAGITMRFVHFKPRYGTMNTIFIVLSWASIITFPQLWTDVGATGTLLLLLGGLFFTGGALIVGARWPDPWPATFGYHEVWHVMVTIAVAIHYAVMAFIVVPSAA